MAKGTAELRVPPHSHGCVILDERLCLSRSWYSNAQKGPLWDTGHRCGHLKKLHYHCHRTIQKCHVSTLLTPVEPSSGKQEDHHRVIRVSEISATGVTHGQVNSKELESTTSQYNTQAECQLETHLGCPSPITFGRGRKIRS